MSFPFRRMPEGRKTEAKRARKENITSHDLQNTKNKLGLAQKTGETKTRYVLSRYAKKPRSWKAQGITKEDFKKFGIKV